MSFTEELPEPKMISYLDLHLVLNNVDFEVGEDSIEKLEELCNNALEGVNIFSVPAKKFEDVQDVLWELGMNIYKHVEQRHCHHRPQSLAMVSKNANTPVIYGLAYFGEERNDSEWIKSKILSK